MNGKNVWVILPLLREVIKLFMHHYYKRNVDNRYKDYEVDFNILNICVFKHIIIGFVVG